ncbi:hypothetical protein FSP39_021653 [Pinctada imbricata]|uniref:Fatty acid desaturase domain-containing protein n=1 Tax=Pinctada imbricata TaxID=66713 RepID=A0AA88XTW5_PINIB|nr:hypothetical protein FSP39_021653 [Pinctada imbricata]
MEPTNRGNEIKDMDPCITEKTAGSKRQPLNIVWRNVVLMTALHLGAVYSLTLIHKSHHLTWIWTVFYYLFSAMGITAGAHRLWSHRSYRAKTPLRVLLAVMQTAAFQNDILDWARDHRVHHKYSETDADPHNARRGFFFAHIGWLLVKKHPDVKEKGKLISTIAFAVILMCFVVPTFVPYLFWGESLWNAYFLAGILRYCATLNATWNVNSFAHLWGPKPYDKTINPSENMGVAFSTIGEGFHNYHHTFPHDYSTSEYGWRLNLTTVFIDFMARIGQASERRKIPPEVVLKRKQRTGDGS